MDKNQIGQFKKFLESRRYTPKTIRLYIGCSGLLLDQLYGLEAQQLEAKIAHITVIKKKELSKSVLNSLVAAMNQFFLMQTGFEIRQYRKTIKEANNDLHQILDDLLQYLLDIRKYTKANAHKCLTITESFLRYYSKEKTRPEFSKIDAFRLRDYIRERSKSIKISSLKVEVTHLRVFFRYLEYSGISVHPSVFNLRISVPCTKGAIISNIFSEDKLQMAVDFFCRDTERDVRNKLIVLFLVQLGLRTSDISSIILDDIHLLSGTLTIRSTKTKSERILPITTEIGQLLEKYIIHFRPVSKEKHLFLRIGRNRGDAMTTENIRCQVRFMMNKTGLYSYWTGPHAFRRSLGSKLYNAGNSLKEVADILGHSTIESTITYTKIDIEELRSIAAEWPVTGGIGC